MDDGGARWVGRERASDGGRTSGAADSVAASGGYFYVILGGGLASLGNCATTASPGADIDVVALYRGGVLLGVGKPGSVRFSSAAYSTCSTWGKDGQCSSIPAKAACHNDPNDVSGGLTTKMYADPTLDSGYFGLGRNVVELQIGSCRKAGADVKGCDGAGEVVEVKPADVLAVFEVDGTYKAGGAPAVGGIAPENCDCVAEAYDVYVGRLSGRPLELLGTFVGSHGEIIVK